ncbi:hypothetical protein HanPSC8_Chr02g0070021 [Helianthus annuus]|nr:hypothetical protein HanPSC8_Chr02g0070021 [Helianthus annuus]
MNPLMDEPEMLLFITTFAEHVTPSQSQGSESNPFQFDKTNKGSSKISSLNEFKA